MDVSYVAGLGRPDDAGLGITHVLPKTLASITWGSASVTGLGLAAASASGAEASMGDAPPGPASLQDAAPIIVKAPASMARRPPFLLVIECASVGLVSMGPRRRLEPPSPDVVQRRRRESRPHAHRYCSRPGQRKSFFQRRALPARNW